MIRILKRTEEENNTYIAVEIKNAETHAPWQAYLRKKFA